MMVLGSTGLNVNLLLRFSVSQSLPNIIGSFSLCRQTYNGVMCVAEGAFTDDGLHGSSSSCFWGYGQTSSWSMVLFNASDSNPIYQPNASVVPSSFGTIFLIKY